MLNKAGFVVMGLLYFCVFMYVRKPLSARIRVSLTSEFTPCGGVLKLNLPRPWWRLMPALPSAVF